ncbi:MAG: acyl-CoA dehydrogenase family protein [Ilumatobacteraceae bacterium]
MTIESTTIESIAAPPVDLDGLLHTGRALTAPAARIHSAAQAEAVARELAARWAIGAADRDRDRVLPWAELDEYSGSGLWSITVPRRFRGAAVPYRTLANVITTIAEADPSIAQITQNHYAGMSRLALIGDPDQQAFVFERVLAGERVGNPSAEPGDVPPGSIGTTLRRDGEIYRINGRGRGGQGHHHHVRTRPSLAQRPHPQPPRRRALEVPRHRQPPADRRPARPVVVRPPVPAGARARRHTDAT